MSPGRSKSSSRSSNSNSKKTSQLENFEDHAFRIPLQPLPLHNVDLSQVMLSNDNFIATRISREFCNVFVTLSQEILPDQFIVIRVLETDPTLIGGLRLHIEDLNEGHFCQRIFLYSDPKCAPNEYLIFWLSECGNIKILKNSEKEPRCLALPKKNFFRYRLVGDLYGSVTQLRVFFGDRKNAEPFLRKQINTNLAMSVPSSNSYACCLSSVHACRSDNTPPYLIFKLYGNEIILIDVEFSQNLLTANSTLGVVAKNNLETKSSEDVNYYTKSLNGRPGISKSNEDKLCKICMENEANIVLIPCGHVCLCYECTGRVRIRYSNLCPICRSDITQTQKIYFS